MGYRLCIDTKNKKFGYYGTKLYGYYDHEDLLSFDYLVRIGKFDGDEYIGYSSDNRISLNKIEFMTFIYLYNFDLNNQWELVDKPKDDEEVEKDFFVNDEDIKKLMQSNLNEYIISWG